MASKLTRPSLRDIMITDLRCVSRQASVRDAAGVMKEHRIGDVVVLDDDGQLQGILTDRDIVVRAICEGADLDRTTVGEICTVQVLTLTPDASVDTAIQLMREHAIRRVPVLREGSPIGIVSLGDLAQLEEPRSALGRISAAPPSG